MSEESTESEYLDGRMIILSEYDNAVANGMDGVEEMQVILQMSRQSDVLDHPYYRNLYREFLLSHLHDQPVPKKPDIAEECLTRKRNKRDPEDGTERMQKDWHSISPDEMAVMGMLVHRMSKEQQQLYMNAFSNQQDDEYLPRHTKYVRKAPPHLTCKKESSPPYTEEVKPTRSNAYRRIQEALSEISRTAASFLF